ncbi:MAG: heat-inducible transcriptional repressor [Candidatus Azotimanducaceae bacterium]|jgi:heat-inducible transcriptional repressor
MVDNIHISEKAQMVLKSLVERYIADGLPVGSKTLAAESRVTVSSATVRNIMADLEDKGYVTSPHTSAGRIPTAQGYRFFVDSLPDMAPLGSQDLAQMQRQLDPDWSTQQLVQSTSSILSNITQMAGLVTIPRRDQVTLRHVEFLSLNANRVLVILVLADHEVQNRIIYTNEAYTEIQLKEASNFINQSFTGRSLGRIREQLINAMKSDRENLNGLMVATLEVAEKAFELEEAGDYVMAGQENLVEISPGQPLEDIRNLFKAFSLKGDILHLLDRCLEGDGVQLFIGHESGYELLGECSVVISPYCVDGQLLGVLGVIGPTRMAYQRVIPVVDATAQLLSAVLASTQSRQ